MIPSFLEGNDGLIEKSAIFIRAHRCRRTAFYISMAHWTSQVIFQVSLLR